MDALPPAPEEVVMVTADLIFELAVLLTVVALLMIPRLMVGRMYTLAHHRRRHAHVRSMHRLRHVRQAAE